MKNWAGNLEFFPKHHHSPRSHQELMNLILMAVKEKRKIRYRGSGHSWTGLIATEDIYLDLDQLQGLIEAHGAQKTIRAHAGTKLSLFGEIGHELGLAMENQGDINLQSLAGAVSTGTHGTGIGLQSIANQVTAVTLINGKGEEVSTDKSSPFFNAARLSLGSLGVLTSLTFKLEDSYKLKVETYPEKFDQSLKLFEERLKNNRHLEMFYFPVGEWSITKIMNKTQEEPSNRGLLYKLNEIIFENWFYTQLNRIASKSKKYKLLDKLMYQFVSPQVMIDWSHQAYPTQRSFKFMEMEYNLPFEKFHPVMAEIRQLIKERGFKTLFPIEIRFVKGDNIWLSPAYERDSVYFAIHTYISEDYRPYFDAVERIFQKYQGRPHWGKWHTMNATQLKEVYPKFNEFLAVRKEFDPEGVFLNEHLEKIFGL